MTRSPTSDRIAERLNHLRGWNSVGVPSPFLIVELQESVERFLRDDLSGGCAGPDGTGTDLVWQGVVPAALAQSGVDQPRQAVDVIRLGQQFRERRLPAGNCGVEGGVVLLVESQLDPGQA